MCKKIISFIAALLFALSAGAQQPILYKNANAPSEDRINDLLQRLTLKEKISLLGYDSPAIDHLQIPAYNWWNEALHGVARAGEATVFPQAIGMAATFNDALIKQVASAISTEARAKYNLSVSMNRRMQYFGLTFWTPNINIFRDPRWGRGQETYGEDPFLTGTMGMAFVKGLQGDNPNYYKAVACAKHFAVHSGPESTRHSINVIVDEKDLRETYLYAFKKLVVDAKVGGVMCAYNRVNNEPCCTGNTLLHDILHNEWDFKGYVVTDCWALSDVWQTHKTIPTAVEVAAAAVKAGVNLECGEILPNDVMKAIDQKLLTESDVDNALRGVLRTEIKLGFFNDGANALYKTYRTDSVHNKAHVALARKVAQQSMVLLKNDGVLPLKKDKYSSMLITGTNSSSIDALLGNYHGITGNMVTFAEGITAAAGPAIDVQYEQGCTYTDTSHFGGSIWISQGSDVTIAVIGLTALLEGEDGDAFLSTSGGDKATLNLPEAHIAFVKKLRAASKNPLIVVVTAGSDVDIAAIEPYADAVILAWYPGEQGGNALADIVFGKVCPSGRLPVTFYKSLNDVPDFSDYNMKGRTYRYYNGAVQYPFGYGLSYTSFTYQWLQQPKGSYTLNDTIHFSVAVANTGNYDGDDVVQAYITYPGIDRMPIRELKAFKRVSVSKGGNKEVALAIPVTELQKWDMTTNNWKLYPGQYSVNIAKNASDVILTKKFTVK